MFWQQYWSNPYPGNMGFCIACFIRDIAGALACTAAIVQYIRPEIPGWYWGVYCCSCRARISEQRWFREYHQVFLVYFYDDRSTGIPGLPAENAAALGGDLNAILGLVGFIVGIIGGVELLKGFNLGRAQTGTIRSAGYALDRCSARTSSNL